MTTTNDKPVLLPLPVEVKWGEGEFNLSSGYGIKIQGPPDSRIGPALKRFVARVAQRTKVQGVGDLSQASGPLPPSIFIEYQNAGLPVQSVREDESYTLEVTTQKAMLSAPNPLGVLHGLQTLLQLISTGDGTCGVPCVTIHDKPRFPWRGLMIDACRHWMPAEVIKRNLDAMEEAKLNVFHWHLSENQGFRIECKTYPKLHEMGSNGLYYTQDQVKDIVAYARERGIRVIPEFDVPGHSTAWLVGYPELASAPGPYEVEKKFGVFDPCLNPASEETYRFLDGFVAEMSTLFPDDYFHIGGDEVNGKHWNENADIQRFMYREGLKTNEDLQGYFNGRLEKILAKHHRKMVGWDEIFHPGLPKNIVVHSWRGADSLAQCAKLGFDGILSNGYYLDLALPASTHYAMDPLPEGNSLKPEEASHILGGEACMWTELVTPGNVDSRIWPATLAVAERLWSSQSVKDIGDFYKRMEVESGRLEEVGLTHRSSYAVMLKALAGGGNVEALKTLADVVEPVKNYQRHKWGNYSSDYPLDRLVDAVRPESETARHFKTNVDAYLKADPQLAGNSALLRTSLENWAKNHKSLEPMLEKSDLLADAQSQSQDLSATAQVGLEALEHLKS
ncbi:MAG TPA: family 20 glycosylhydrolase, partial [bacterium]|nr:family 20 glycosylhydrolase [bacterium]